MFFLDFWNDWENLFIPLIVGIVVLFIFCGLYLGGCFHPINSNKAIINSILTAYPGYEIIVLENDPNMDSLLIKITKEKE